MSLLHEAHLRTGIKGRRLLGPAISLAIVLLASLSGALVFPLSALGRTTPASASREWLLLLIGWWIILAAWAVAYAAVVRRLRRLSWSRSLHHAALCHSPLLLCLGLAAPLYWSDLANHLYASNVYGQLVFQPLAKGYVLLAPALAQGMAVAARHTSALARAALLAGILLTSLLLRLWNLDWGLPALLHPDEHQYIGRAFLMLATGDLNPHYFENPSLMIYVTYGLYLLLSQQAQAFHVLAELLGAGVLDPRGDFLVVLAARSVSAVAGTLTVLVTYLAGRELFGRGAAALGACLLGVAFLHVRNSHYATNDVLATLFLALSFLFAVRIYARGRGTDYLMAGLCGGLAASAKYNAGIFAVATLLAHLVAVSGRGERFRSFGSHIPLAAAALASLAGFLAATPYALLDLQAFVSDFRSQFGYGADLWHGQSNQPALILFLSTLGQGFGLIPLLAAALGAVLLARDDWRRLALLVSVPVAYLLFMSSQRLFFARFAIPLLPFLALLGGYALWWLIRRRTRPLERRLLASLALAAALLQPMALSVQHGLLLGREDTRSLAAAWIDSSIPSDASLAMESYAQLDGKFGWKGHGVENSWVFWPENPQAVSRALGGSYQYVVVTSFGYGPWQRPGDPPGALPSPYGVLEAEARLLAVFGPGPSNGEVPFAQDDMYTPFWHLADRERPGPTIRVYGRFGHPEARSPGSGDAPRPVGSPTAGQAQVGR